MAFRNETVRRFIFAEFFFLVLTFLLGMYVNLYSTANFPIHMNFINPSSGAFIMAHMAAGIIVTAIAVLIFIASLTLKKKNQPAISLIAMLLVILSAASGLMFAFVSGMDYWSYLMAVGFVFGIAVYGALLSTLQTSA